MMGKRTTLEKKNNQIRFGLAKVYANRDDHLLIKRGWRWPAVISILAAMLLSFFILNATPVRSQEPTVQTLVQTDPPLLQVTATPAPTSPGSSPLTLPLTLGDLGYGEAVLHSPVDKVEYSFRLPPNWQIAENSFVELDLSYRYSSLVASSNLPATFANLTITLNGQTVENFAVPEPELDHYRLRIPLPAALFNEADRERHTIGVSLEADFFCVLPHSAALVIHPTSSLYLNYTSSPLSLDLSAYPAPFFQNSFNPDETVFGLPAQPSLAEATGAVAIAAKLGHLTESRMVMSATTDLDLAALLSSPQPTFDQHLIIIGQPQHNQLVPLLNRATELPITLHERQMSLVTRGPTFISPGQVFSYTFTVTNTTGQEATLSLVDTPPKFTGFVDCEPQCAGDMVAGVLTWTGQVLPPAGVKHFLLVLKATEAITNPYLENTLTLVEAKQGPINGDTLVSQVSLAEINPGEQQVSGANESDYFFVWHGQAVAENDGIIQEVVSPWNANRAILLVTGLNDEAIKKASQAMSSEARLPGIRGALALVQDALPPQTAAATLPAELTFQELGYSDKLTEGRFGQKIDYFFAVPAGWQLTDQASLELLFTHTPFAQQLGVNLTVIFNGTPAATMLLDEETAQTKRKQISLPASAAQSGELNRLTLQFNFAEGGITGCQADGSLLKEFWFVTEGNSKIFLHHQSEPEALNLNFYPYPFSHDPALLDLLFALPAAPTADEWGNTLRLAAGLGNSGRGPTLLPAVTLGDGFLDHNLADYHLIAIGRPLRNPLIQYVNAQLPQPFLPNSDEIRQQIDNLIFRLPPGLSLGYLQLLPSPWNEEHALLAVTGTSDQGVTWATQTLLSNRARQLKGNLALIRELSMDSLDTRKMLTPGVAPVTATVTLASTPPVTGAAPLSTPTLLPTSPPSLQLAGVSPFEEEAQLPFWLIPFVVVMTMLGLAIFIAGFIQSKR